MAQSISTDYFHQTSPKVAPIPFRMNMVEETIKKAPLRIGYFVDDGFLKPVPGCARVVNETVAKLTAMGHELIPFTLPKPYEAAELCFKTFGTDSGYLCKLFNDELPDKYMSDTVSFIKVGYLTKT
jgi:Asp-tRNA(Asn)/Glu-tRNA(Gln) amidotransferase A subunit family amidase